MKVEDLLTFPQAAQAMGTTNRRAVYRAVSRAVADGHDIIVEVFGKKLIRRDAVKKLTEYYYPYYSEAHQRMVKKWGAAGGKAAGVTKRTRAAKR